MWARVGGGIDWLTLKGSGGSKGSAREADKDCMMRFCCSAQPHGAARAADQHHCRWSHTCVLLAIELVDTTSSQYRAVPPDSKVVPPPPATEVGSA